jgi:hypothetical protein
MCVIITSLKGALSYSTMIMIVFILPHFLGGRKQNSISDVFLWDYAFTMHNFIFIKIKRKACLVFSGINNVFCNGRAVKGIA